MNIQSLIASRTTRVEWANGLGSLDVRAVGRRGISVGATARLRPVVGLVGLRDHDRVLETEEHRFGAEQIAELYADDAYPLPRA